MKRPNISFLIAAGVSLVLHAVIFLVLPRFASIGLVRHEPDEIEESQALRVEPAPEPAEPPLDEFEMGEATGKGYASNEVEDTVEAIAPEADADQGFLSLDPSGAGKTGKDAAISNAEGDGGRRGQPSGAPAALVAALTESAPALPKPFGVTPDLSLPRVKPKTAPPELISPAPAPPEVNIETADIAQSEPVPGDPNASPQATPPAVEVAVVAEAQPSPVSMDATGSVTTSGAQQPAADPARMSDSESDPFSRLGTATFRDGKLDIRFGRKVKTRKPKILIAGQVALLALERAKVVLDIKIDETGKVTGVKVAKSSGSNEIDQPTRIAIYDWWFEPKLDAAGLAVADEVQFTISWR